MAHSNPQELTAFVIEQMKKIKEPREREIFTSLVQHLHAFVSEVRLSEAEFHKACGLIARLGQQCTPSHNEVVLMAGSLGVSSLVCLTNNGDQGTRPTTANLMGPFWRQNSPIMKSGEHREVSHSRGASLGSCLCQGFERPGGLKRQS